MPVSPVSGVPAAVNARARISCRGAPGLTGNRRCTPAPAASPTTSAPPGAQSTSIVPLSIREPFPPSAPASSAVDSPVRTACRSRRVSGSKCRVVSSARDSRSPPSDTAAEEMRTSPTSSMDSRAVGASPRRTVAVSETIVISPVPMRVPPSKRM